MHIQQDTAVHTFVCLLLVVSHWTTDHSYKLGKKHTKCPRAWLLHAPWRKIPTKPNRAPRSEQATATNTAPEPRGKHQMQKLHSANSSRGSVADHLSWALLKKKNPTKQKHNSKLQVSVRLLRRSTEWSFPPSDILENLIPLSPLGNCCDWHWRERYLLWSLLTLASTAFYLTCTTPGESKAVCLQTAPP